MMPRQPYNPLDKLNLGASVADALIESQIHSLPPRESFKGAGIYAIYYNGDFEPYAPIARKNRRGKFEQPIYVGKAVPAGARKGSLGLSDNPGEVLFKRLREHADSIGQVTNLNIEHFFCRFLPVDDIWIPLGESLLIHRFSPLWNKVLDGFGNHTPGKGRFEQRKSPWDTLHPGRAWAEKCQSPQKNVEVILEEIRGFLFKIP